MSTVDLNNPINDPSSIDNPLNQERLRQQQLQEVEQEEDILQNNMTQGVDTAKEKEVEVKPEATSDASRRNARNVQNKV